MHFVRTRGGLSNFPVGHAGDVHYVIRKPNRAVLINAVRNLVAFSSSFSSCRGVHFCLGLPHPRTASKLYDTSIVSILQAASRAVCYCYCKNNLYGLISSGLLSSRLQFQSFNGRASPLTETLVRSGGRGV